MRMLVKDLRKQLAKFPPDIIVLVKTRKLRHINKIELGREDLSCVYRNDISRVVIQLGSEVEVQE
jgi:hypothetical protein